eukprot:4612032-Amphidinium_carterae.1
MSLHSYTFGGVESYSVAARLVSWTVCCWWAPMEADPLDTHISILCWSVSEWVLWDDEALDCWWLRTAPA